MYLKFLRNKLFQVNQMDSTDKKLKRMKVFKARVENKAGKAEFFENVTHVLRESMGRYYFIYLVFFKSVVSFVTLLNFT